MNLFAVVLLLVFMILPSRLDAVQSVTLTWSPVTGASGYNVYTNKTKAMFTATTNGTVINPTTGTNQYNVTAIVIGIESSFSSNVLFAFPDTNVYVTNFITIPWYQEQYGPKLIGTNWANHGTPFAGQFTNLPSAFIRLKLASNQIVGFTIQTNPPPDVMTAMEAMKTTMKLLPP